MIYPFKKIAMFSAIIEPPKFEMVIDPAYSMRVKVNRWVLNIRDNQNNILDRYFSTDREDIVKLYKSLISQREKNEPIL